MGAGRDTFIVAIGAPCCLKIVTDGKVCQTDGEVSIHALEKVRTNAQPLSRLLA
jgi:hypothetical protein